ncbi:uncharacterized protein cubi_03600 [Cryptosporidium ubiquitum]|uniref:Uncharacterized protein n=1 Tax=Cryptosporidium ubiquitum TaxID=857276 RepID=A0A1J4MK25_9CRYT|nr:uncharacterized protein cubi_03600 [Cryptosporidium ubiquitum]OII73803.1 hypothetical protein cubi_03600 [Cryptosporidium ubiquitum]
MNQLSENDQELKTILDGVMINNCIKPFRQVSEKLEQLDKFAHEYGNNVDSKINQMLISLRKDEINCLKLEMRLEKILELVIKQMRKAGPGEEEDKVQVVETVKQKTNKQEIKKNIDNKEENADERTFGSSINSIESVPVDPLIKRTLEYEKTQRKIYEKPNDTKGYSMYVEEETCDEISVKITTDGSARSLISKYINGENKNENEVREKDPNAIRRERVDNIKRTVKPLVRDGGNKGKCCGFWKKWCCCCLDKGPTKSGKYYKMSTQEWKDFLAAIEPKDKKYKDYCNMLEKKNSSCNIDVDGLPPLVVEYSSLNAQAGGYYNGNQMYNMGQNYQYYYPNNYQGYYNGQYYYDAKSQASNMSYGNNNPNYMNYKKKGRNMQEDIKCKQMLQTKMGIRND